MKKPLFWLIGKLFWIISAISLIWIPIYLILSLNLIISSFHSLNIMGILSNLVLLIIEVIGYLFAFYLFYMISGAFFFRSLSVETTPSLKKRPFFSVIIPSHGTSYSILVKTLEGALNLDYDNYEIIVSDNGQDPSITDQLKTFCEKNHIQFYHKLDSRGFKAGNINAVLEKTHGEFIVVLDSDHIPVSNLLTEFSNFSWDEKTGYIQAKVGYRNTKRLYQKANSILYSQFYEVFEAAKDQRGVVLFNGTTGCFRRDVLFKVNGFSEETLIEDIDTSMKILSQGYHGRYINFVGSYGKVPDTAYEQIAQLWRWSNGASSVLRLRMRMILGSSFLSLAKKFELILNAMAFFSGISVVMLMSVLAVLILGNIPFLRPQLFGWHTGYVMPSFVTVSYSLAAILAILWEPRKENLLKRTFQLIPFYLFSLGTFLFLISGVVEGLILKKTALSEGAIWNREFRVVLNSILALCYCTLLILVSLLGKSHQFAVLVIGGVFGWIMTPLMLLYEKIFPPPRNDL